MQLSVFCAYHLWHYDRFRCLRYGISSTYNSEQRLDTHVVGIGRWDNPRSGVFKRFMTVSSRLIPSSHPERLTHLAQYTYILSLPTLATFAIGSAAIKYKEGFVYLPGHGSEFPVLGVLVFPRRRLISSPPLVVPKPYELWNKAHLRSIFPLMMILSFTWALEM